jgi:type I restriction enzyme M protein
VDGRYRIGATALITSGNAECVIQSHFRILSSLDHAQLDPFALLYALNLPSVRQGIRNLVFIQSTLGTLGQRLFRLEIPLLVGEGPWSRTLMSFRESLIARAERLSQLRATVGESADIEL